MEKKRHALKKLLEAVEHELLKKPNRKTLTGCRYWLVFKTGSRFRKPCMARTMVRRTMR